MASFVMSLDFAIRHWILVSFLALVMWHSMRVFRSWYRLRKFKGPKIAALTRFWLASKLSAGNIHRDFHTVNDKYGPLARIGPNDLVAGDPAMVRRMLAVRSPYTRSDWYHGVRFDPSKDNIASERDEKIHGELRNMMAPGYSGKENEDLEGCIDRNIQVLVNLIRTKYLSTEQESRPMDFGRKAQYLTLDVISDAAYREAFGYLRTDSDLYDFIATVENVFSSALMITIFPWLNWVLRLRIMKAAMPTDKDPSGMGAILGITNGVVAKRFGPNKIVEKDMLGSFIAHGLTQDQAESETVLQILAGSDTTATAIRSIMSYLVMSPRIISKLRAEISSHNISTPITDAQARKMPYLQAIIKEGLRIFPPVTGLMSKQTPPEGDTIDGVFIPGGTKIGYGMLGIFHDRKLWGEDPAVYRPERWLGVGVEKEREMDGTLELIFGYGKWKCLGSNVAWMELNKVFVELFRQFDFNVVNPLRPMRSICYGLHFQSEFWLTAFERA
ncbi:related to pisatin demethylase (cytochrome P450) [Rhynchosporium agropyri]|uniref:Related to pisatin demethylase (Cytochrome P450) n=1 Tax=Rhynchosporium agropyri TaxID=914238 RepID=A0A1E1LQ39_9HELO|nr:related to pisatin demethylase (cytochrome P450) [Rhynchosporium agropyri]